MMDDARREANWGIAKWLLASIELCRSDAARKIKFDVDKWDLPQRERNCERDEAERQRKAIERDEAAKDPARLAAYKAARIAEFERFKAMFRGPK